MKLDTKRHYGTIYGEPLIHFTQDGKFFDAAGNEVGAAKEVEQPTEVVAEVVPDTMKGAMTFLKTLLNNTQMSKEAIVKEAELQNVSWHNIENAANELGVVKFQIKGKAQWRLATE